MNLMAVVQCGEKRLRLLCGHPIARFVDNICMKLALQTRLAATNMLSDKGWEAVDVKVGTLHT